MCDQFPSYEEMDTPHRKSYVRPLIDGRKMGGAKCLAYCHLDEHPGFLDQKLIRTHRCVEKGCKYYQPKQPRRRAPKPQTYDRAADILEFAEEALRKLEGLKPMKAEQDKNGDWVVGYAAVASYDLGRYEKKLSQISGEKVHLRQLPYSFENAARLIFKD